MKTHAWIVHENKINSMHLENIILHFCPRWESIPRMCFLITLKSVCATMPPVSHSPSHNSARQQELISMLNRMASDQNYNKRTRVNGVRFPPFPWMHTNTVWWCFQKSLEGKIKWSCWHSDKHIDTQFKAFGHNHRISSYVVIMKSKLTILIFVCNIATWSHENTYVCVRKVSFYHTYI